MLRNWAASGGGFNPIRALWPTGTEPGLFYLPRDLSSGYQDSAGTTAGAVDSPVGLRLDRRLGRALGPELATGAPTPYTANGTVSVGGDGTITCACTANGNYGLSFGAVATANKRYLLAFDVVTNTGTRTLYGWAGTSGDAVNAGTTTGTKTGRLSLTGGSTVIAILGGVAGESFSVRSISVRELPGNHALQATTAARPYLRQDGSIIVDRLDGTDDGYSTAVVSAGQIGTSDMTLMVAMKRNSTAAMIPASSTPASSGVLIGSMSSGSNTTCCAGVGSAWSCFVDAVQVGTTGATTRGELHAAVGSGAMKLLEFQGLSLSDFTQFSFGLYTGWMLSADIACAMLFPTPDAATLTKARKWCAAQGGITL